MFQAPLQRSIFGHFEFDTAGAIERLLREAADVAGGESTSAALAALEGTLCDAFATGDERTWRDVYAFLADIAKNTATNTTPAALRLRVFLAENIDLSPI